MANIFEIRVKQTKNLGNYESKTIEAAMQLQDNEDSELAMIKLEEYINNALYGVKPSVVKEVVDDGKVLTLNNEIKDPSSGKEVKKKVTKKTTKKTVKKVAKKEKEEVKAYSKEDITKGLQEVWKKKGKEVAKAILENFKAKKISELKEDQYQSVMVEVEKCLK